MGAGFWLHRKARRHYCTAVGRDIAAAKRDGDAIDPAFFGCTRLAVAVGRRFSSADAEPDHGAQQPVEQPAQHDRKRRRRAREYDSEGPDGFRDWTQT